MTTRVTSPAVQEHDAPILNRVGYGALREAAQQAPRLFINPDVERLQERIVEIAGTADIWDPPLPLAASLSPLNEVSRSGPQTDAEMTPVLRTALEGLPLSRAADERMWGSLNTFSLARYVSQRWRTSRLFGTNPKRFVLHHWIDYSRPWNAGARLWWLAELATRLATHSRHGQDVLLEEMSGHVNLYHQMLYRTFLVANPRLAAIVWDCALDGDDHLFQTKAANQMLVTLNVAAGGKALDLLDTDALRALVKGAIPKKKLAS